MEEFASQNDPANALNRTYVPGEQRLEWHQAARIQDGPPESSTTSTTDAALQPSSDDYESQSPLESKTTEASSSEQPTTPGQTRSKALFDLTSETHGDAVSCDSGALATWSGSSNKTKVPTLEKDAEEIDLAKVFDALCLDLSNKEQLKMVEQIPTILAHSDLQLHRDAISKGLRHIHPKLSAYEAEDLAKRWQSEAALNIILHRTSMGHTPFTYSGVVGYASRPARRTGPSEEQVLASQRQSIMEYVDAYLKIAKSETKQQPKEHGSKAPRMSAPSIRYP
jgi:hypothetical protein